MNGRFFILTVALLARVLEATAAEVDCLVGWRVAGTAVGDGGRVECRDGDPTCDADVTVDGRCTFAVALCVGESGCEGTVVERVRVRGRGAHLVRPSVVALDASGAGPTCALPTVVGVRPGRHLAFTARASAPGARDRDRLRLACTALDDRARAVVVTTDFESGQLATLGVTPPHRPHVVAERVHEDAVVRTGAGLVFVLQRFLGDSVDVRDPARGMRSIVHCPTGPGSNPHDVAAPDEHKAYVTRYDKRELLIVDPRARSCDGFRQGEIDLGPFADGDGLPEMSQTALVGDRLFVAVQRLDRDRGFAPTAASMLVVIDTTADTVTGTITLSGRNAFGDAAGIQREPGSGKLLVSQAGDIFRTGDGGIERVDPETLAAEGFLVGEDALGGSVTDFVFVSATTGYALVITERLTNLLVGFDTSTGAVRRLLTREAYLPDIALAPDGTLWLADQTRPEHGIRIFDPADDREITRVPIGVGLPPFSIGFTP